MRRLINRMAPLLAAWMLTACAAGVQPMPDPGLSQPVKVPPPANTTTVPQALPQPRSGSLKDLEANHREVARLYHQLVSQVCQLLQYLGEPTDGCPGLDNSNDGTPDGPQ